MNDIPDRAAVQHALSSVVDPELGLAITDLGLVRAITLEPGRCRVDLTMTSAACPQGDLIAEEAAEALRRALGPEVDCRVKLVWDPPWTPDDLSEVARSRLQG